MLVLASASPRRKELLGTLVVSFQVLPANIDETPYEQEAPADYVVRMAKEKAQASIHKYQQQAADLQDKAAIFIASDTSVVIDGNILGKPASLDEAKVMLRQLSGRSHQVLTSLCISNLEQDHLVAKCVSSDVCFRDISDVEIEHYWRSGEPQDKAGSYAIQGLGAVFVRSMSGSYSAIVGLPLFETSQILSQFGIHSLEVLSP
ncbi:septum formation inhibitor Maf [Marinomonas sp. A79]|uniref:dTTP/UTP pyrophosphatase n=1 Tax=Marinomonas vulgaris TaxID=2823372 RepID=A0ABS5H996_9GAMM|nr:Maf family protein [Marinomonas vulgaris]MBR7887958.1 septum formation inhibitor Maf [Marinomonas vulgaris]